MSTPNPLLPDRAFDFYEIVMWSDLCYRVRRTHTRGQGMSVTETHDYLTRGEGGQFLWQPYVASAATWDSVQGGAISLVHMLNKDQVTG